MRARAGALVPYPQLLFADLFARLGAAGDQSSASTRLGDPTTACCDRALPARRWIIHGIAFHRAEMSIAADILPDRQLSPSSATAVDDQLSAKIAGSGL